ncbi:hypothetical protein KDW07_05815 [Burkholderia dolosa]|uniref:hypothetical protein n=1 Tax=Burkholderia dolosa TaxID=152500 RepID=UPI0015908999|nr:hypothetical protein [Burkholderia dolosa]MBR8456689.1 hypothetical protein [Burkholderia dolosa]
MEHKHIPGLVDVIEVDQPAGILQVARDSTLDRAFGSGKPLLNSLLVRRILGVLSRNGHRLPTMSAREAVGREIQQDALWKKLNAVVPDIRAAPADLESLAVWIRGSNPDVAVGPLVQQIIGRLFNPTFEAGEDTWAAAQVIAASLAPGNALCNLVRNVTGKVTRAKALLASMVGGDLAGVHAASVAIHNVVRGLNQMRSLYLDTAMRQTLTPEMASQRCLFAPGAVLRQATSSGTVGGGCPYTAGALLLLELEKARQASGDESMIFLGDTWSRCPAEQWVLAMLDGVWRRATTAHGQ